MSREAKHSHSKAPTADAETTFVEVIEEIDIVAGSASEEVSITPPDNVKRFDRLHRALHLGVRNLGVTVSAWLSFPVQFCLVAVFYLYVLTWAKEFYTRTGHIVVGSLIYVFAGVMGVLFVIDFVAAFVKEWNEPNQAASQRAKMAPFVVLAAFPILVVAIVALLTDYTFSESLLAATAKLFQGILR